VTTRNRLAFVLGAVVVLGGVGLARASETETAVALYQKGKYAEAEAALRGETGAEAEAYRAAAVVKQGRHGEAEKLAKAALLEAPNHAVAVAALGEALVGGKKLDEAIQTMTAAADAKPDLAYAYYWRGQAYYQKKQPDRLIGDFEAFLKLAPTAPEATSVKQFLATVR
jgi:tetratricopeptide (TPR) repeat protein